MTTIYNCLENNEACLKKKQINNQLLIVVLFETFYDGYVCFVSIFVL